MTFRKVAGTFLSISIGLLLLCSIGCIKEEYSYEGGNLPPVDSTGTDTTQNIPPPLALTCSRCSANDPVQPMQWHFMYGTSALCGPVTNAVISPDRTAMTFFGPSACTIDTGLIMTAFFDTPLDRDRTQVYAARAVLQYYNKNAAENVFQSDPNHPFTLIIDQYTKATKTATGRFSGYGFTPSGTAIFVESGTFFIHF